MSLLLALIHGMVRHGRQSLMLTLLAMLACGCSKSPASSTAPPPAKVAKIAHEEQLNTIELTAEAESRLGVTVAPVEKKSLARMRPYGAEAVLPAGASMIVSAPLAGRLQTPTKGTPAVVGMHVSQGQKLFELLPLLSPERAVLTPAERVRFAEAKNAVATSRVDAVGLVQQGEVQVDAAKIALERAERLLREQAGTARAVDDAKAQLNLAQKSLDAARSRQKLLDNLQLDETAGTQKPLDIESPQDGIVRSISAAASEAVAMGAPLFEVADLDPIWIRVPVYVGELPKIAIDQPARISRLGERAGTAERLAAPVNAPPTALALASAVDLYFGLANAKAELRPGERVIANLMLADDAETLTIPWSAVVHDINGGTWVYEQVAPQKFVRRRVQVRYVIGETAALGQGPPVGSKIVTTGAVELFGTEFGFAK